MVMNVRQAAGDSGGSRCKRWTSVDAGALVVVGFGGKRRRVVPATFKNNNRYDRALSHPPPKLDLRTLSLRNLC